jgi:cell division topological specificity factor
MTLVNALLHYLRGSGQRSAAIAKERLQLVLAHERAERGLPDFLPALREELLGVIAKYMAVDRERIKVSLERHGEYDVLELNVAFPERAVS